jgi:hypothetical protein
MSDLIFALAILSGFLSVAFLLGGAVLFDRNSDDRGEKDELSGTWLVDFFVFGSLFRTISNIRRFWKDNREGRLLIYIGTFLFATTLVLAVTLIWIWIIYPGPGVDARLDVPGLSVTDLLSA